jgi:hypothetical protein
MEEFVSNDAWIRAIFYSLAICVSGQAHATKLDEQITFHIKPQTLETALLQFSRQADLQLAFASDLSLSAPAHGIDGKLAVSDALTLLLDGSGLSYTVVGSNTVTVIKAAPTSRVYRDYINPAVPARQGSSDSN